MHVIGGQNPRRAVLAADRASLEEYLPDPAVRDSETLCCLLCGVGLCAHVYHVNAAAI